MTTSSRWLWTAIIAAHPDWMSGDGLHPLQVGNEARAQAFAAAVFSCSPLDPEAPIAVKQYLPPSAFLTPGGRSVPGVGPSVTSSPKPKPTSSSSPTGSPSGSASPTASGSASPTESGSPPDPTPSPERHPRPELDPGSHGVRGRTPVTDEPGEVDEAGGSASDEPGSRLGRRAFVVGALGLGVIAIGAAGVASGAIPVPARIRLAFKDTGVDGVIPDAAVGTVQLERRTSAARGQEVGFFTAVPAGYGDGEGLPVCMILHGATATTASYAAFGFPQFLTAAVEAGAPPFVLVGADGGRTYWAGDGVTDDPQRMVRDEIPAWCEERGYDTTRMAAYGWSMGGHGALLVQENNPGWLLAVAALSPAVSRTQDVFTRAHTLDGTRTGIWCGTADALYPAVQDLVAEIPGGPAIAAYAPGAHTRGYWNRITPDAFAFIGAGLGAVAVPS